MRLILLVLAFGLLALVGCSEENPTQFSFGQPQRQLLNPYFQEFMHEYAFPEEALPPIGNGELRRGKTALAGDEVVRVLRTYPNGSARVRFSCGRVEKHFNLVPEQDGAYGLYSGYHAVTSNDRPVFVRRVFADGRVWAEILDSDRKRKPVELVSGVVPELIGDFEDRYVLNGNEVMRLHAVFLDGRAVVHDPHHGDQISWNLIPRKNGAYGLREGRLAHAEGGSELVRLLKVFADGRAEVVFHPGRPERHREVVGGLSPHI